MSKMMSSAALKKSTLRMVFPRVFSNDAVAGERSIANGAGKGKRKEGEHAFTMQSINPNVVKAEYAVRGEIPIRAEELREELQQGKEFKFKEIVNCNIGNPQQLGQKPITWIRQVISLVEYPELIENPLTNQIYPKDALKKARSLLEEIGNVGAYSHSKGVPAIRQRIAKFLERRDGVTADPEDIFLTNGASSGVSDIIRSIVSGPQDGVLIPIPQYPLYTASLALNNAHAIPYYLNEKDEWSLDVTSLSQIVREAREKGIVPKAMAVINPGNPTGSTLSENNIRDIIKFCFDERLVLLADEVYQNNIYEPDTKPFCSMKRVLRSMEAPYSTTTELVSFHSISKGQIGECGRRGGYFELVNIDPEVKDQIYKVASISLCSPVTGQIGVDLMLNPPVEGEESYDLWKKEVMSIHQTLEGRSKKLLEGFRQLEGIECHPAVGAMYLFPAIKLPQKAIDKAKELKKQPDAFYCLQLLEETGICLVPGSGFGQVDGTYHFRTTFLPPGVDDYVQRFKAFHEKFMTKFAD